MSTAKPLVAPVSDRWWRVGIYGPAADGSLASCMNPERGHAVGGQALCVHCVQAKLGSVAVKLAKQEHRKKQCGGRS